MDKSLHAIQNDFMAHIREPNKHPKPSDVEDRRMAIYRDLFFNNIEGFVASAFPVLKSLYSELRWQALVRQFFELHDCQSPYFLDISEEFLEFISTSYTVTDLDPVFMLELAHYEWVELDVSVTKPNENSKAITTTALTSVPLYLAETAKNLSYQYPVHMISQDYQPSEASVQPHYFVVYRDSEDDVQFLATNAMTALLLNVIEQNPAIKFESVCHSVAEQVPQFSLEQISQGALVTLTAMAERGVIVTKNHL